MGKEFYNLTPEQLCDLMCGKPEKEYRENRRRKNGKKSKKPGEINRQSK